MLTITLYHTHRVERDQKYSMCYVHFLASPSSRRSHLSGVLNDKYQKVFNGMQERHQQSRANRRRGGGRRRDDLKDSAYTMPQIVIEQEPTQRRVG